MMIKQKAVVMLLLAVAPLAGSAADGTINFSGKVTDKTCTISTQGGKDFSVTLPAVSKDALASPGAVAGRTPFAINLTGCSGGGKVAAYFESGTSVDSDSGKLINQAAGSAAGNVQLQILGSGASVVAIRAAGASGVQDGVDWVDLDAGGTANLNFFAEYYATAAATPGDVASTVKYTIVYD